MFFSTFEQSIMATGSVAPSVTSSINSAIGYDQFIEAKKLASAGCFLKAKKLFKDVIQVWFLNHCIDSQKLFKRSPINHSDATWCCLSTLAPWMCSRRTRPFARSDISLQKSQQHPTRDQAVSSVEYFRIWCHLKSYPESQSVSQYYPSGFINGTPLYIIANIIMAVLPEDLRDRLKRKNQRMRAKTITKVPQML